MGGTAEQYGCEDDEFPVLVRYNEAVDILHKVRHLNEPLLQWIGRMLPKVLIQ